MAFGKVVAVVGAQFGSEGKGVVATKLAPDFKTFIRTGAPNAGHSIVHKGRLFKMQTIPCGWVERDSRLLIGPGALVNVELFLKEVEEIAEVDATIFDRVFIDEKAGILEAWHHKEEGGVQGELHKRIGSTGEGVGVARRCRLERDPAHFRLACDVPALRQYLADTVSMARNTVECGNNVMLEGTQGCGLSLIHGFWPHVTTNDTNAAQLAADAGLPPQWVSDVVLVARTYPIRVAGASGPLNHELSWDQMSERVGREVKERTTVTKKVRRIGEWDEDLMRRAMLLNDPTFIALTFMDYLDPASRGAKKEAQLGEKAQDFIHYLERTFNTRVGLVGTDWSETEGWTCVDRRVWGLRK